MKLAYYIQEIQLHLISTHAKIFKWFGEETIVKDYRPLDQGWTISEILEHIALTSHFLLILIDKGTAKALHNIKQLSLTEARERFDYSLDKINDIGVHKSFDWIRPAHMEPKGEKTEWQVKDELVTQLNQCLNYLEQLKNGDGLLYETTMTVNGLGKINVYEYIYFLSKHAERHIQQMTENKEEYINMGKSQLTS